MVNKLMVAARPLLFMMLVATFVGCATTTAKKSPQSFDAAMARAESQVAVGGVDAAIIAFEETAQIDPVRKEPWVRIAQLQFDRNNYARAIVASEEVLQRDPDDLVADGVITLAGLRVANQSLQRLQGRGALASDTARKEAKALADILRATMGDAILEADKPKRAPARRAPARRPAAAQKESQPAAKPAESKPESKPTSSDPFKNLGGD